MEETTICALSTPVGTGGIAVIRVSGPEAMKITGRIFSGRSPEKAASHTALHGFILDHETGEKIDEVLILCMRGPHTFTGEDTVEIDCHGGMYICRRILDSLIKAGCRPAERGEYSKRAFMNGRMDLNEAEAVMDMIGAQTSYSLRAAVGQLGGALSSRVSEVRKQLMDLLVLVDVNIDYPEYDVPEISDDTIMRTTREVQGKIRDLLRHADSGKLLRSGIGAALVGSPNVGKSSILNMLLGEQRAIVTDIPGTTRDVLEEALDLDGILVRLMDTAGIRHAEDEVEKIGVSRSLDSIRKSDLVLWVMDLSRDLTEPDPEVMKEIGEKPCLVLMNKCDLLSEDEQQTRRDKLAALLLEYKEKQGIITADSYNACREQLLRNMIFLSAARGQGMEALSARIREMFFDGDVLDEGKPLVTNARQKDALIRADEALTRVLEAEGMPQDLLAIDLKEAFESLGEVNGTSASEEIVTEIFSRFCLGK